MKIETKRAEAEFKPIEVTMTIETWEELNTIQTMCRLNTSIPEVLDDSFKADIVKDFLDMLRYNIDNY